MFVGWVLHTLESWKSEKQYFISSGIREAANHQPLFLPVGSASCHAFR